MSTLISGFQAHGSLGSSISVPTPVHLARWQEEEEEEDEDEQEINSGSTPKQGTGSSCWSALCDKVYALFWTHVYDLCFVVLYPVTKQMAFCPTRDTLPW